MNTNATPLPQTIPLAVLGDQRCAWCWYAMYPTTPYPEEWSSTVCSEHFEWVLAQRKKRKQLHD